MRIYYYCQHVLGVGHFFRSLEICRALGGHDVTMITGGAPVDTPLPPTVSHIQLPGLMMDTNFSGFYTTDPDRSVDEVKAKRIEQLNRFVAQAPPEILVVELYPFGRKAFRFELDPVLEHLRTKSDNNCLVVCSLRDILVEKKDPHKYEKRVVDILNNYFDLLLIHADPHLVRLEETFTRLNQIDIPVRYTGFIAPMPTPGSGRKIRCQLNLCDDTKLIVASTGGGSVGEPLLTSVIAAFRHLDPPERYRLQMFCGPFLPNKIYRDMEKMRTRRIGIERFSNNFLSWMAAADLSVSMAGYNTCMNILATGTPALVWPFNQNREQSLRARRLARMNLLQIAATEDLAPARMAVMMRQALKRNIPEKCMIEMDGAARTADAIQDQFYQSAKKGNPVGQ